MKENLAGNLESADLSKKTCERHKGDCAQTLRQTDRQTDRRQTDRQTDRQIFVYTYVHEYIYTQILCNNVFLCIRCICTITLQVQHKQCWQWHLLILLPSRFRRCGRAFRFRCPSSISSPKLNQTKKSFCILEVAEETKAYASLQTCSLVSR